MLPPLPNSAAPDSLVTSKAPPSRRLRKFGTVEGRDADLGEIDVAAVGIGADDAALVADRNALQLAGGEAVLLQLVDLDVAVGVGELGEAAGAERHRDVAEIDCR